MPSNSVKYPSKDVCIYCGKKGILLTDEHVVPFSLGGKHIILRASCVMCNAITMKFEQDVTRGLWGEARASYNAPTRRKKERVKSFVLKDPMGIGADLTIPAEHYPAPMVFYRMSTAGILVGSEQDHSPEWQLVAITDDMKLNEFENKYPGRFGATFKNVPRSFGRMIAKIGYCHAITALDPGDFNPICLPYILGKKSNVSYVVGGRPTNDPPQPDFGYSLRTIQVSNADRTLLVVEVRLIANSDTPTYHVVVGEVVGQENSELVNIKLSAHQPPTSVLRTGPSTSYAWIPKVWPLSY